MLVYLYGYLISFKDGQYISLLQFIFPVYMLPDILNEQIKKKKPKQQQNTTTTITKKLLISLFTGQLFITQSYLFVLINIIKL